MKKITEWLDKTKDVNFNDSLHTKINTITTPHGTAANIFLRTTNIDQLFDHNGTLEKQLRSYNNDTSYVPITNVEIGVTLANSLQESENLNAVEIIQALFNNFAIRHSNTRFSFYSKPMGGLPSSDATISLLKHAENAINNDNKILQDVCFFVLLSLVCVCKYVATSSSVDDIIENFTKDSRYQSWLLPNSHICLDDVAWLLLKERDMITVPPVRDIQHIPLIKLINNLFMRDNLFCRDEHQKAVAVAYSHISKKYLYTYPIGTLHYNTMLWHDNYIKFKGVNEDCVHHMITIFNDGICKMLPNTVCLDSPEDFIKKIFFDNHAIQALPVFVARQLLFLFVLALGLNKEHVLRANLDTWLMAHQKRMELGNPEGFDLSCMQIILTDDLLDLELPFLIDYYTSTINEFCQTILQQSQQK